MYITDIFRSLDGGVVHESKVLILGSTAYYDGQFAATEIRSLYANFEVVIYITKRPGEASYKFAV